MCACNYAALRPAINNRHCCPSIHMRSSDVDPTLAEPQNRDVNLLITLALPIYIFSILMVPKVRILSSTDDYSNNLSVLKRIDHPSMKGWDSLQN